MKEFFYLEGAYIIISFIIIGVTIFVTTRPFMSKNALKKGLLYVITFLFVAIITHFLVTKHRMEKVKEAFYAGKVIRCENRVYTKGANFIDIKNNGIWKLEKDNFINPNYSRSFFIARCFVK